MLLSLSIGEVKGGSLNSSKAARMGTGSYSGSGAAVGRQPLATDSRKYKDNLVQGLQYKDNVLQKRKISCVLR